MTTLLLQLLVLTCQCCPHFEPTAPYTTREVESGWGEPLHGLSILATTDSDTVHVGDAMKFEIFFRYNSFEGDGRPKVLDEAEEDVSLHLVSRDGSRTFERAQFNPGGPEPVYPDPQVLESGDVGDRRARFYLLSNEGEQVPPGDYLVHVAYRNTGWDQRAEFAKHSRRPQRDSIEPGAHWSGTVASAEFTLHVVAKVADTTRCELPSRVWVSTGPDGLPGFQWDPTSFQPVMLRSRPGYHVSCQTAVTKYIGDEPVRFRYPASRDSAAWADFMQIYSWGWMQRGGFPTRGERAVGLAGPRIREGLTDGQKLRIVFEITVFETSEPPGHMWQPERGDYRVLKSYKIVETWP